jgi:hypothetical protein|tara:strand:- start:208 stop:414 length:207 start_codon:yes stop_codon:yes gene_type:complete
MIIILLIGIIALVFGILLLVAPNSLIKLERQANKIVMTDPFFMKYRVIVGIGLLMASAYMIYQYIQFA